MVTYTESASGVGEEALKGFFVGWPSAPTPAKHLEILKQSDHIVLAIDQSSGRVVGFINAVTDNILSAYIPLLEVLPEFQRQGIGKELVRRMLSKLQGFYMIDLVCDERLQPFYDTLGMSRASGMMIRNYQAQSGKIAE